MNIHLRKFSYLDKKTSSELLV